MTEAQYQAMALHAAATRLSVPSCLAVTGLRPDGVDAADAKSAVTNLSAVRRVLAGVANNLNQLTARVHASGELNTLLATVRAVNRLTSHVEEAVDQVAAVVDGRSRRSARRHT